MPIKIQITADPEYDLFSKVGSITLEYGVKGRELELELRKAQDEFVQAMEMRGLTLYRQSGFLNPVWVTNEDGEFTAFYAIDWEGKRTKKQLLSGGVEEVTHTREFSLEETEGEVEYRIVGVFWGPKTSIEILKSRDEIRAEERASRNPIHFGPATPTGQNTQ